MNEQTSRGLLIAGLFPALAQRRRVSVEYFIDLGRGAYQGVADSGRSAYADLFAQLASTYHQLVHTLRAVRGEPVVSLGLHRHGMLH